MEFLERDGMTRFEKARIISARALQISMGAPVLLDKKIGGKPAELARKEMEEGVIPLTVRLKEPPRME